MINEALNFISTQLNTYFRNSFEVNEDKAIVSNLVNHDGTFPVQISDKMVISLINVESETTISNQPFVTVSGNTAGHKNPPVNINLNVLFAGYFNNYNESLKFLSGTIGFFQGTNVFLKSEYPALGENINKLVFELLKTDYQNINYLWGAIGAKYVPSVIYKLRMLTIDENNWKYQTPLISTTNSDVNTIGR